MERVLTSVVVTCPMCGGSEPYAPRGELPRESDLVARIDPISGYVCRVCGWLAPGRTTEGFGWWGQPLVESPFSAPPILGAVCPRCRSEHAYFSRSRTAMERLWHRIFPTHTFQCADCGWRGQRRTPETFLAWRARVVSIVVSVLLFVLLLGLAALAAYYATKHMEPRSY